MAVSLLRRLKPAIDLIYPPECAGCRAPTDAAHGLCPACWADTAFITGPVCDCCGLPQPTVLPGQDPICDRCAAHPPGWDRGRAAVLYDGTARQVILRLKHGDRLDLARVLAAWAARAGAPLLAEGQILAPVPLHWSRLLARRYNQAAEILRHLPPRPGQIRIPDLLIRRHATPKLKDATRAERFRLQSDAIGLNPRRASGVRGRHVLVVDDVMTSGATLAACAEALRAGGARHIAVLAVARVAKEGFDPI